MFLAYLNIQLQPCHTSYLL